MLRSQEHTKTTGATFILGGAFLCSLVFIDSPYISFITLTLFILGDGAAALIGMSIGRTKILNKTLEGSLACFLMCMMLFAFLFPYVPFLFEKSGKISIPLMITTSLSITLLELIPIKISNNRMINDNLYVPVLAGLIFDKIKPLF
jgi:dolichol kinase